jgi:hypothetical protein
MKKIISVFVFALAFSWGAEAQTLTNKSEVKAVSNERASMEYKEQAKKEYDQLSNFIELSEDQKKIVWELTELKQQALSNPKLSKEEVQMTREGFGQKLMSILSQEQIEKLKSDEKMFKHFFN